MAGPLSGYKIIELVGLGPAPFGCMMLADLGAEVIRIDRPGGSAISFASSPKLDLLNRGKRSVCLNLKDPAAIEILLQMVEKADAIVEGNRPGVLEKLGLGPDVLLARNPKIVIGRMTGWGQDGPLAHAAGHDLNYIALAGALHPMGYKGQKPAIPLNLVGDFGGGGLLLAYGILAALLEAQKSGIGQVVDANMMDGVTSLMAIVFGAYQSGFWSDERGTNMLDGGSFYYNVYETLDGKYVTIGSIEPQFYAELLRILGEDGKALPEQYDMEKWPEAVEHLTGVFKKKTREQWCELMEGTDVCFAPVLSMSELKDHPHHKARGLFNEEDGVWQPTPAPRFSRTEAKLTTSPVAPGANSDEILAEFGFDDKQVAELKEKGSVA
ncbi:MAG: CaiB/BaiF CoA-transferase family protein [Pseudomonadales bacterium]